jgi:hypothetical protein
VAKGFISTAFLKVVATLTLVLLGVGILIWWVEHKKNPQQFKCIEYFDLRIDVPGMSEMQHIGDMIGRFFIFLFHRKFQ